MSEALSPYKKTKKPTEGIEPSTAGLQNRCSTVELHWPKSIIYIMLTSRRNSFFVPDQGSLRSTREKADSIFSERRFQALLVKIGSNREKS